jgi:predicted permease
MSWISRLINAVRPERATADLDDELRFHFGARVDELIADGMSRREAERAARRKFGAALQLREESRDVKSAVWLESLLADFRFGVRMLRKTPHASLAAIGSLALAIGACTAAFSLLDALVFRGLPVPDAARLVNLARVMPGFLNPAGLPQESDTFSYEAYRLLRDQARDDADLFAFSLSGGFQPAEFDDAGGVTENVRAESISGRGFEILGVRPALGRLILTDDDAPADGHPVAVLSYAFWKRRFAASPSAIGKWVKVGNGRFQIVGVAARDFTGVQPGYLTDLWVPLTVAAQPVALNSPDRGILQIWGRLQPGGDPLRLAARLRGVHANFLRERVYARPPRGLNAAQVEQLIGAPLRVRDASRGRDSLFRARFAQPLRILGLICVLLLLVACSNVGNLLIARAAARQPEMALRASLGASRARLAQQMFVEAAQIAVAASMVAIAIAAFAAPAVGMRIGTTEFPAFLDVALDARSLAFAAGVTLLTDLLCGMVPSLRASASAPRAVLQATPRVAPLKWMLAAQVGFCVAVLFLSGLLLLSFGRLISLDPGFRQDNVALLDLQPRARDGYRKNPGSEMLETVRHLPGVAEAALSQQRPMGGDFVWILKPFVRMRGGAVETVRPTEVPVSAGFFQALGVRWIAGRDFLPEEIDRPSQAVIVNQAFADLFLPGRNPIGQTFDKLSDDPEPAHLQIVGVAANARWNNLREPEQPTIYTPLRDAAGATLLVRTSARTAAMVPVLRKEVEAAAPALSVRGSILLSSQIDNLLVSDRLLATLGGFFSVVSLLLAGVGLYGVMHFAAVRRTREIGVRMALGAKRGSVIRMMVADASLPVAAGIAAGIGGGVALARYLIAQLFGVRPIEFWSLAVPLACILMAAAIAVLPPAIRASQADPATILRQE